VTNGAYEPEYAENLVSELFHENTKQWRSDLQFVDRIIASSVSPVLQQLMANAQKRYPAATTRSLATEWPPAERTFDDTVLLRRSSRSVVRMSLPFEALAKILHFAGGVTGAIGADGHPQQLLRASPSAGALYPVELYVFANDVDRLTAGAYHFNPAESCLELVSRRRVRRALAELTFTPELMNSSAVFALTGISAKSRIKYGERAYRFMLLEAGHIAQNILLTASSLGLGAFSIGGFVDAELDDLLGLDGVDEVSLYLIAVGSSVDSEHSAPGDH
jgi:SagB-type dehydrogenase family enzyme